MKSLSYWAKLNPRKAQLSIVTLYIIINILAVYVGLLFHDLGIRIHGSVFYSAFILFLLSIMLYRKKGRYFYRKTLDLLLISCTFMMIGSGSNQMHEPTIHSPVAPLPVNGITSMKQTAEQTRYKSIGVKKSSFKKIKKQKQKINTLIKALLITLVVAGALVSIYLIGILSCNISCSGAEGLAIVVLVLGLIGVLGGAYFLIRRILGYKRRDQKTGSPGVH